MVVGCLDFTSLLHPDKTGKIVLKCLICPYYVHNRHNAQLFKGRGKVGGDGALTDF